MLPIARFFTAEARFSSPKSVKANHPRRCSSVGASPPPARHQRSALRSYALAPGCSTSALYIDCRSLEQFLEAAGMWERFGSPREIEPLDGLQSGPHRLQL